MNLTLHDLRRVYLNRLREKGVSLETAMALTGHRSVTTVMTVRSRRMILRVPSRASTSQWLAKTQRMSRVSDWGSEGRRFNSYHPDQSKAIRERDLRRALSLCEG